MNLKFVLEVVQVIISVLLIVLVLIQSRGSGLASSISGFSGFYRTKRGLEKVVFILTIVLGIGFAINSATLVLLA